MDQLVSRLLLYGDLGKDSILGKLAEAFQAWKGSAAPRQTLVRQIYEKFLETGSLAAVGACLRQQGRLTRKGRPFTRFAIRAILTNPVYMIADAAAFSYLTSRRMDLSAERTDFDGQHGIMAYNRTLQRPGKTHQIRPMEEWIVTVGGHPGLIAGRQWVRVQKRLEDNRKR